MQMLCTSAGRNMGSCRNSQHLCKADILILISDSWSDSEQLLTVPKQQQWEENNETKMEETSCDCRHSTFNTTGKGPLQVRSGMRHSPAADWFVRWLDTIPAANGVIHRKKMAASSIHPYWKWSRSSCCSSARRWPTDETTNNRSLSCVVLCFSKLPTVLLLITHLHV